MEMCAKKTSIFKLVHSLHLDSGEQLLELF